MEEKPMLKFVFNADNSPVSAKCSACGKEMPQGELRDTFVGENLRWFRLQFEAHKKAIHPLVNEPKRSTH